MVFDSHVAATAGNQLFAESSRTDADIEHIRIAMEPVEDKVVAPTMQRHLQAVLAINNVNTLECHGFNFGS